MWPWWVQLAWTSSPRRKNRTEHGNLGWPLVSWLTKIADSWSMPMPRQYWPSMPS